MKAYPHDELNRRGETGRWVFGQTPRVTSSALQLVSGQEMEVLCLALRRGQPPADLRAKLALLRVDHHRESYLRRQSLLLLSLLTSPGAVEFCRIRPQDCERLLRMLAYVRKDDDAIPDTWPHGFDDDHDLMRMTCTEMKPVLEAFKAWHLSRRVPLLWTARRAPNAMDRPFGV